MSVKSRILQFQKEETLQNNSNNNNGGNNFHVPSIVNGRRGSSSGKSDFINVNQNPSSHNHHAHHSSSITISTARKLSNGSFSSSSNNHNNSDNNTYNQNQHTTSLNTNNINNNSTSFYNNTPTSISTTTNNNTNNNTTGATTKNVLSLSSRQNSHSMEKPAIMSKTSLSINLNNGNNSQMNGSGNNNNSISCAGTIANHHQKSANNLTSPSKTPTKGIMGLASSLPFRPRTPTSKSSLNTTPVNTTTTMSSIPKPSASNNNSVLSKAALWNSSNNDNNGSPSRSSSPSSSSGGIDWKMKYEESERKRLTVVTLAQKATRDYEELRRRYKDSCSERDKLGIKLDDSIRQLDLLRKASESAYNEYYKLKKQYETENRNKSEALTRVDQYNKENRRLKRQSMQLLSQLNDPSYAIEEEVDAADSVENDQEITYLRKKVQELEGKVVNLETELEKTKLDEFETQEFMLMNDAGKDAEEEMKKLIEQIKFLEDENRKLHDSLDDALLELDNIKAKDVVEQEKLMNAENELRKIRTEKNILQRQSMVFMSEVGPERLMDALNQIGELQTVLEEQKTSFQEQITQLNRALTEKESADEAMRIQTDAHIKSLEEEVKILRERAEEAERKLEEAPLPMPANVPPPPPPPPPPPMMGMGPPPPPMPSSGALSASISSGLKTLRKTSSVSLENIADDNSSEKTIGTPGNAQIDDVVSQIKKGIKLRSTQDRGVSRRPTEVEKAPESVAVEEMKNILNNLKRIRRC